MRSLPSKLELASTPRCLPRAPSNEDSTSSTSTNDAVLCATSQRGTPGAPGCLIAAKVLTPNDFPDLDTLEHQLLAFGRRYEQIAAPFQWKLTRADLDRLAQRLDQPAAKAA
jgi:hypothetical protein